MAVDESIYAALERTAYYSSLLLERSLSQAYSILRSSASTLKVHVDESAARCDRMAKRAWWDPSKGSAIVVWAPGEQRICHALSLALASVRSSRSVGGSGSPSASTTRAGQPPYTVIVLVPERSSNELASLISSWAKRKAEVSEQEMTTQSEARSSTKNDVGTEESEEQRRSVLSWATNMLGLEGLQLRVDSPDTSTYLDEHDKDSIEHNIGASNSRTDKKRKLSFGGWSAQDVVGYGRDMLKGLRIGQMDTSGVGAVIPVVVDTTTRSGLLHAQSTIQAYCLSHDLLLRAVILVPSIMGSDVRTFTDTAADEGVESIGQQKIFSLASKVHDSMSNDVDQTMNVLATLLPVLKSDGGRVISLLPAHMRLSFDVKRNSDEWATDRTFSSDASTARFTITRNALHELWTYTRSTLEREGVFTSLIHMASSDGSSQLTPSSVTTGSVSDSYVRFSVLPRRVKLLLQRAFCQACPVVYGMSWPSARKTAATTNVDPSSSVAAAADDDEEPLATSMVESYAQAAAQERASLAASRKAHLTRTSDCPPLLLDAVRSALVRSWPRRDYAVGLGPRIEMLWEYVPGHSVINRCITALLL